MIQNDSKRFKMIKNDSKWFKRIQKDSKGLRMIQKDSKGFKRIQNDDVIQEYSKWFYFTLNHTFISFISDFPKKDREKLECGFRSWRWTKDLQK